MMRELEKFKEAANGLMRAIGCPNQTHLNVLVVDDSMSDFMLLQRKIASVVKGDFALSLAQDIPTALSLLPVSEYDAYLVDYAFPKGNGVDFIAAATEQGFLGPFILWTGMPFKPSMLSQIGKTVAVGYLDKNSDGVTTCSTIRAAVEEFRKHHLDGIVVATKPETVCQTQTFRKPHEFHQ